MYQNNRHREELSIIIIIPTTSQLRSQIIIITTLTHHYSFSACPSLSEVAGRCTLPGHRTPQTQRTGPQKHGLYVWLGDGRRSFLFWRQWPFWGRFSVFVEQRTGECLQQLERMEETKWRPSLPRTPPAAATATNIG